jgi:hypothetical protein
MDHTNPNLAADYFLAVGRSKSSWSWQIHGKSQPLGVNMVGGSLGLSRLAQLAGEKALHDFLERLTQEAKRQ